MDTNDCVFCGIIKGEISSNILYEDDLIVIINDIMPKAPVHFLVLSKEHIVSVNELTDTHSELISHSVLAAKKHADERGVRDTGYKLVWNVGRDGGQIIPHLHLHVLGGKQLAE